MGERITLDHGSGGRRSRDLVRSLFQARFSNDVLDAETDAAILDPFGDRNELALTTDAHVVKPLWFPGGDIGRLAICGTVNDLTVAGAEPRYICASFIIEEGFALEDLESITDSMADAAAEAGVRVVAGDTKVVERGACDGLFIATSGVGVVPTGRRGIATAAGVEPGDSILVNGPIGDHGAAIACVRNGITTDPPLVSDCAPLWAPVRTLYDAGITPHFMRDATRGGLTTVLCELAEMRSVGIEVREQDIPVRDTVRGVCELYGFDPLALANEGTMICVVSAAQAGRAIEVLRQHKLGRMAASIGHIGDRGGRAEMITAVGGRRILRMLAGEQLPRIC